MPPGGSTYGLTGQHSRTADRQHDRPAQPIGSTTGRSAADRPAQPTGQHDRPTGRSAARPAQPTGQHSRTADRPAQPTGQHSRKKSRTACGLKWSAGRLLREPNINSPLTRAVGGECDDDITLTLTQLASTARHVITLRGRTDDDTMTGRGCEIFGRR